MKIEDYLDKVESMCESAIKVHPNEEQLIRLMYRAIECTIYASRVDNDNRLGTFIQLLMVGNKYKEHEKVLPTSFISNIIAADYYFSVKKGRKAIPFLTNALDFLSEYFGHPLPVLITDTDEFRNEFRSKNLKDQQCRMDNAVKNILILHRVAQKLDLDLYLPEVLLDYTPTKWIFKDMPFIILLSIVGGTLFAFPLAESMAPWHAAKAAGTPISLLDAFTPMDIPYLCIGLFLIALAIFGVSWFGSRSYIHWMSKWTYWKFCK